ncbi:MAG TPA: universal stress protein [Polyangia bacterium]|jgi:nucleotide-binding universal stress UspA family protein
MKLRKIFAATDLSEPASEALRQADELSRATGAELVVCHVMPNPLRSNMLFPQLNEQIALDRPAERDRVVDELTSYVAELTGRAPEDFAILVDDGTPHRVLVEKAEHYGADLVVVGSHGHGGLGHIVLGGVAEQVVRWAHCPVLIARPAEKSGVVLAATDFSAPAQTALAAAAEEARRRGARLTLMHVMDLGVTSIMQAGMAFGAVVYSIPPEVKHALRDSIKAKLGEALAVTGVAGDTLITEGTAAASIVQAAEELQAELVVVGTAGVTGLKRLTLGSVAEAVARHAACSVLVVRQAPAA